MKLCDLKPLKAVAVLKKHTPYEVLITLQDANVEIYTINSSAKKITYDYIEVSDYGDDGIDDEIRVDIVAPGIEESCYKHGEIIQVSKDILSELAINKRVSESHLFSSDDHAHRISSKSARDNSFKLMTYDDLYVHKSDLDNVSKLFKPGTNERSPKRVKPHVAAIKEACINLGASATASAIFVYITDLAQNSLYDFDIEFDGGDIRPYDSALSSDFVMLVEGRLITKKRFQNICSEIKNKK
ncbi:MAG: hypothetical protein ISR46_03635 [Rhodospirillales bacterium]|nr:hypothetical protein [Rhodospirillales bacterium]